MSQIVIESYRKNASRINSTTKEIKRLLQQQDSLDSLDPWLRYLKQCKWINIKINLLNLVVMTVQFGMMHQISDMKNDLGLKRGAISNFKSRPTEIKAEDDGESDDDGKERKEKREERVKKEEI